MSDRTDWIAILLLASIWVGSVLGFGIYRDPNSNNPQYAQCWHQGGTYKKCIHYVGNRGKKA